MPNSPASQHQRKARSYLAEASQTTDLKRRQELLDLCEQELAKIIQHRDVAKAITRYGRKMPRRTAD